MNILLKNLLLTLLLVAAGAAPGLGQGSPADTTATQAVNENKSLLERLSDGGLQVRRAFDGTKNEGKAALFQFLRDFKSDSNSFSSIDIAVKVTEIPFEDQRLYVYPVLEWHRKVVNRELQDEDSHNKASASLKGEWGVLARRTSPVLIGSAAFLRDFKGRENEGAFTIESTLFSNIRWLPGSNVNNRRGYTVFKYYPYLGYEYYLGLTEGIDAIGFLKLRLYAELYPLADDRLKSIIEYAHRFETGSDLLSDDHALLTASAGYSLTEHFSIVLEYEYGESPRDEFEKNEILKLGFGLKF